MLDSDLENSITTLHNDIDNSHCTLFDLMNQLIDAITNFYLEESAAVVVVASESSLSSSSSSILATTTIAFSFNNSFNK
ncbi:hypothetical protein PPL_12087 [Heterostelium album PN500]|uniref:Uncharacterized protein n=1 Tax=Heterostelium pallidum (strain ATCC 26659 / Pp 5 / PN500) TaxID=670386 RepID=D3BLN4_HETP5|nr:hypothetical protein PPL_12087 [Heterostelium album PN500]EFA77485.1 hypothetical protein PPL_12087 [Heterostelium album PN500]|eukprot:XP_020429613.1 hypothetical protein PPL_12087 [Heterostelium album PN500]